MRVTSVLLALSIAWTGSAVAAASFQQKHGGDPAPASRCPPTASSYYASRIGDYRGQRLAPKKLTELPPATTYMAVLREIGGCDAPLTMVEYRGTPRR